MECHQSPLMGTWFIFQRTFKMSGSVKKIKSVAQKVPGVTSLVAGGNGLGAASDLLLGKKDPGTRDSYVPLDPLQEKALGKYGTMMDQDMGAIAENAIAGQEKQIHAGAQDLERKATGLVAQRGLGASSVGLNSIINTTRNTQDQIADTRAKLPGLKYDMQASNLNSATNGINGILNTRIFKQGQAGGPRQGGLLPVLGGGLGAAFGGPAGAGVGMSMGNAITQMS